LVSKLGGAENACLRPTRVKPSQTPQKPRKDKGLPELALPMELSSSPFGRKIHVSIEAEAVSEVLSLAEVKQSGKNKDKIHSTLDSYPNRNTASGLTSGKSTKRKKRQSSNDVKSKESKTVLRNRANAPTPLS